MHLPAVGCEVWFHAQQLACTQAGCVKKQWVNGGRVVANGGGIVATAFGSAGELPLPQLRLPARTQVVVRVLHAFN